MHNFVPYPAIKPANAPIMAQTYNPVSSRFVEVVGDRFIDVKMQYPLLNLKNSFNRCFVRCEVYEKLLKAKDLLPNNLRLRIWDAWRPFSLQLELYEKYYNQIVDSHGLSFAPDCEKIKLVSKYVSPPLRDRNLSPVHTTGGAVDITLIDENGMELNMGTGFDSFSDKSRTDYFEKYGDCEEQRNRRMLYGVMTNVGFTNLPSEWWHYDYGDGFWAYYSGSPAMYAGVFDIGEVQNV